MPFSSLRFPSFALSQLAAVVDERFGASCTVEVIYANHEFAQRLGVADYESLASAQYHSTGVGEWVFRKAAFPDLAPASDGYFAKYFPNAEMADMRAMALRASELAPEFCANLVRRYDLGKSDVVGVTSMFAQTAGSVALARAVKHENPAVVTVIGGANCETVMGAALASATDTLDLVFSGPALRSFPEFLSRFSRDSSIERCDTIPGVISLRNSDSNLSRAMVGAERPIDQVVNPRFDAFREAFDITFADTMVKPILFFETSRGCWWGERAHCTFCGLNGTQMDFRAMAAQHAINQFNDLFNYHPWCSAYHCVDNIMPTEYVESVFPNLDTPPGSEIFFEIKVGKLKREDLEVLARAGVNLLQPGIESLYTPTLKLMRKGTSSFQNLVFLTQCKQLGIRLLWSLLIGFPLEEEEVYQKYAHDLPRLSHLPPPMGVFTVRFDRYSPYYTEADTYGLKLTPFDYYRMVFPFSSDVIENMAYYFTDQSDLPYKEASLRWQPRLQDAVRRWRQQWNGEANPTLRLEHTGQEWTVLDSRSGTPVREKISLAEVKAIHELAVPRREDRLHPTEAAVDKGVLGSLRSRGLLFEENGRLMTLVENVLAPLSAARAG